MCSFLMLEKQSLQNKPKKSLRKSERLKRRKRIILISISLFTLIFGSYLFFLYHPSTSFQTVDVSDTVLASKVKRVIGEKLQTKYFGVFPFDSVLTPSLSKLESGLLRDVPELSSVFISRSLFAKKISVSYTLRSPRFQIPDGRYVDDGLTKYSDDRAPKLPVLQTVNGLSLKDLKKLIFLKDTVESALFTVESVDIDVQNDVVFVLSTPHKTRILFSLKQDEKDVWSKIVSAIDIEPLKSDKGTFDNVQSIDARFGNKIYYKMYIEHAGELPTSTATTTFTRE